MIAMRPGEPRDDEVSRLLLRMNSAGTVRRFAVLHMALAEAYRTGHRDGLLECEKRHPPEA